jgi:CBS domain-containing protein
MTTTLSKLEAGRSVAEAAQRMRDQDVGDVLVTNEGKLLGILTDRDVVVRCVAAGADPKATPVEEVCSQALATLSPDDDVAIAVTLMAKKAIRRIPVVEDGVPRGIVSIGDLAAQRDERSALAAISAADPNR